MKVYVGKDIEAKTLPRRRRAKGDRDVPRAERARRWVTAMEEACRSRHIDSAITCEELPDRVRSFRSSVLRGGLAERAFQAMFGSPLAERAEMPARETQSPA